jgi:peptidoglycan/xylan/chitin deacetylase (PgdA/CDA1 family)
VSGALLLHGVTGPQGSRLARLLGEGAKPLAPLRGVTGCFERIVADVSGPDSELSLAADGLPDGAARPEAIALRLREREARLGWGEPVEVPDLEALVDLCRERGRSSVEMIEADPALLPGMQIGSWFDSSWRMRAARRLLRGAWRAPASLAGGDRRLAAVADLAFWAGVRSGVGQAGWRRLTAASYVALVYHRFAGELKPGQDRIDIAPRRFRRQLRALRLAGFRPLSAEDLLAFHAASRDSPPLRGAVVITVDDAIEDCVEPLRRHAEWKPQLFVPTRELGGAAHWIDGEPVASWDEVRGLDSAGVRIGSHTRHHRLLTSLDRTTRREELEGSLADLRERIADPLEILAYPNGDHDATVCRESRAAGYAAAFTTAKGRNGAGADLHCLKRVSVHGHDGALAILWKASTGEGLPSSWLRLRRLLLRRG